MAMRLERDVGITLMLILENHGFVVNCFTDPAMALKDFRSGQYDLVILDIKMPEINGFDCTTNSSYKMQKLRCCFLKH